MLAPGRQIRRRASRAAGLAAALTALTLGPAGAQDNTQEKTQAKTFVMKITLPTLNETQHQIARNFAAAVEKDCGRACRRARHRHWVHSENGVAGLCEGEHPRE
jgi:hypothetical protein